jgi:CMP-2-keto-3-deoxyoctulosonic acid synthetase
MPKTIAMIPARYAATRFPAKLMQPLGAKTVIRHTYDNTLATGLFDEVIVATDSEIIFNEIVTHGGKAVMSKEEHESGSDRIAEAARELEIAITYYEHIGVYAFRKEALLRFTSWAMTPLEAAEKIECLRYLENGVPLKMVITDYMGVEIDTPEDLERAARLL